MRANSKRYVDQMTQNVITLLNIWKIKLGSKWSVSENRKIASRCRIASGVSGPKYYTTFVWNCRMQPAYNLNCVNPAHKLVYVVVVENLCAWFTQCNSSCKLVAYDSFRQKLCSINRPMQPTTKQELLPRFTLASSTVNISEKWPYITIKKIMC
jgi:hypothetical protein